MYKGTGTGLIGLGIVLVVIGAILAWAVTATTSGVNINTVGVIFLVVGIVSCVIGAVLLGTDSFRQSTYQSSIRPLPNGGEERVVQQRDSLVP
jgi:short subunit fatty acids transporter